MDRKAMPSDFEALSKHADSDPALIAFTDGLTGFHISPSQPQLSEETLHAYVNGTARDIDKEIIESYADSDENFAKHIQAIRQAKGEVELSGYKAYAPVGRKETGTILSLFKSKTAHWMLDGSLALAAAAALALYISTPHGKGPGASSGTGNLGGTVAALERDKSDLQAKLDHTQQNSNAILGKLTKSDEAYKAALAKLDDQGKQNKILSAKASSLVHMVQAPVGLSEVRESAGLTAGGPKQLKLVGPTGENVPNGGVTLNWERIQDAKSYQVTVLDSNNASVFEKDTTSNKVVVSPALEGGKTYKWQVKALRKNGTTLVASSANGLVAEFHVLAVSDATALHQALGTSEGKDQQALIYLQFGLLSQAKASINAYLKTHSGDAIGAEIKRKIESVK